MGTAAAFVPTMIFTVPVAEPPLVDAETETVNVPAVVGVPLITPVELFNVSPPGKPEAVKETGERVAVIV